MAGRLSQFLSPTSCFPTSAMMIRLELLVAMAVLGHTIDHPGLLCSVLGLTTSRLLRQPIKLRVVDIRMPKMNSDLIDVSSIKLAARLISALTTAEFHCGNRRLLHAATQTRSAEYGAWRSLPGACVEAPQSSLALANAAVMYQEFYGGLIGPSTSESLKGADGAAFHSCADSNPPP